jgi:hypothetical protein
MISLDIFMYVKVYFLIAITVWNEILAARFLKGKFNC